MSHRTEKFASTLKHALGEILLYEMDNPGLKSVSITLVTVSTDLRSARILVSSFRQDIDRILDDLLKAKGQIKTRLAKKMRLRYIPELIFMRDSGYEMDFALSRLSQERKDESH